MDSNLSQCKLPDCGGDSGIFLNLTIDCVANSNCVANGKH